MPAIVTTRLWNNEQTIRSHYFANETVAADTVRSVVLGNVSDLCIHCVYLGDNDNARYQQLLDDVIADSTPSFETMRDHWTWYLTAMAHRVENDVPYDQHAWPFIYGETDRYELIREMYAVSPAEAAS